MSLVFNPTITQAGRDAAILAANNGYSLAITAIAFGTGAPYDPTGTETALVSEQTRISIAAGSRITPNQVRVAAVWQAAMGTYPINEVGIYAGSTLFAVWSSALQAPIATKSPGVDFVFYYDLLLAFLPSNSVTVTVDSGQSALLSALGTHLNDANAHPQYLKIVDLANNQDLTYVGTVAGTANALTAPLTAFQVVPVYKTGLRFAFRASAANTGAVTIDIGGLGAKGLRKQGTTALSAGDLVAGGIYEIVYDGTNFQVVGLVAVNANTAAQFNDSLLIANTAFVRRALGNYRDVTGLTTATVNLDASHIGGLNVMNTPVTTVNLPSAVTFPLGATLHIANRNTVAQTINRTGADVLNIPGLAASQTSFTLQSGQDIQAVAVGTAWYLLGVGAAFEVKSLGSGGYIRLPNGFIDQWGTVTTSAAADSTVTFPIQFSAIYGIQATAQAAANTGVFAAVSTVLNTSQFSISAWTSSTTRVATPVMWRAYGKLGT